MTAPEVRISMSTAPEESGDVEMQGGNGIELTEIGAADAPGEDDVEPATRTTFIE